MIARAKPGSGRIALGVIVAIVTVLLTLGALPFTICFVAIAASNRGHDNLFGPDIGGVLLLVLAQVLIPTLGLWLTVRLLRGRKLPEVGTDAGVVSSGPVACRFPKKHSPGCVD